jgi:serine/threonine protein kinase
MTKRHKTSSVFKCVLRYDELEELPKPSLDFKKGCPRLKKFNVHVHPIGTGSYGAVHKAIQKDNEKEFAIKVVKLFGDDARPENQNNARSVFENEAMAAERAGLAEVAPKVVSYFICGTRAQYGIIIMDLLDGISLSEFMMDYDTTKCTMLKFSIKI